MKATVIKPIGRLKTYNFNINKVEAERHEEWNSFSTPPKEGEKFAQYSFQRKKRMKDAENIQMASNLHKEDFY